MKSYIVVLLAAAAAVAMTRLAASEEAGKPARDEQTDPQKGVPGRSPPPG